MHLEGYGCAGTSRPSTARVPGAQGRATRGFARWCVGAGVAGDVRHLAFGSEEQKQEWLPRMAAGEAIGCFGLTEPDAGSNPAAMRTRARRDGRADELTGCRRAQDVDHQWAIVDVAVVLAHTDDEFAGFVVPDEHPGFSAPEIEHKLSLRASVTTELVLDDVRLLRLRCFRGDQVARPLGPPDEARSASCGGRWVAARSAYSQRAPVRRERAAVGKPIGDSSVTQAKLADMALEYRRGAAGLAPRSTQGQRQLRRAGRTRQVEQRARGAGDLPHAAHRARRARDLAGVPVIGT